MEKPGGITRSLFSKLKLLICVGITLLLLSSLLHILDRDYLPGKEVKFTPTKVTQCRLRMYPEDVMSLELYDPRDGELWKQGWMINGEMIIYDNSIELTRALWSNKISIWKYRELNMYFLQTPHHYIQIVPNVRYGNKDLVSRVSVIGINPEIEETYMKETRQDKYFSQLK